MPAPKVQFHVPVREVLRRISCEAVPVALVDRRTRIPSARESTVAPPRRPSMVDDGSVAGAKAPVPDGVTRTAAGVPCPSAPHVQLSRPRPTSTQPPPSVVMSQ